MWGEEALRPSIPCTSFLWMPLMMLLYAPFFKESFLLPRPGIITLSQWWTPSSTCSLSFSDCVCLRIQVIAVHYDLFSPSTIDGHWDVPSVCVALMNNAAMNILTKVFFFFRHGHSFWLGTCLGVKSLGQSFFSRYCQVIFQKRLYQFTLPPGF